MIPTFLLNWYAPNHTGRAEPLWRYGPIAPIVPIDPLETAAATLAKHGAEKRRLARVQLVAERNAKLAKWIAGHPRPPLAEIEAELAPLFARLDMRKAARR